MAANLGLRRSARHRNAHQPYTPENNQNQRKLHWPLQQKLILTHVSRSITQSPERLRVSLGVRPINRYSRNNAEARVAEVLSKWCGQSKPAGEVYLKLKEIEILAAGEMLAVVDYPCLLAGLGETEIREIVCDHQMAGENPRPRSPPTVPAPHIVCDGWGGLCLPSYVLECSSRHQCIRASVDETDALIDLHPSPWFHQRF